MGDPTIYHGTPLTPREALNAVGAGRAFCVSFWRPDDVEAVEAISPDVMFRQRGIFGMAGSAQARRALVHPRGLDAILRVAGISTVHPGQMGCHPRRAGGTFPAQRQSLAAMAVRSSEGRTALAHGWPDRAATAFVRDIPACLPRLDRDRTRQGRGLRGMVASDGRDHAAPREPVAGTASHARRAGRSRVPFWIGGRNQRCAERVAI